VEAKELPRILCVDDEPRVLESLALHLRRDFQVFTANSGQLALQALEQMEHITTVVSDMRMPGMDGAHLLKQVRQRYPEITRILLTGEPGRDAAVMAVNEGQIFRFLTKPCAPDTLRAAIEAGVMQHRLMTAEKILLQQTLVGCIKAMIDVLAITNTAAFGRSQRVTRLAMQFSAALGNKSFWQLEAAAMLSQIGYISLPVELVEKLYYGDKLTPEEKILAEGAPQVAKNLLGHIPRLEPVLQILDTTRREMSEQGEGMIKLGAQILKMVLDYDALLALGHDAGVAMQTLRGQARLYDQQMLEKFSEMIGAGVGKQEIRELPLRLVMPGMVMLDDLRTHMGTLLVPKGFEVTTAFMERMRNFGSGILNEKVRVLTHVAKQAVDPAAPDQQARSG
jgi:response regulator RpfG family c-di-GMP phosphodiesterase